MLHLYQANHLENLLAMLCAIIAEPPADPLAAEMVVVQNQGMARWLSQRIAEQRDIAFNLDMPLPARFVQMVFTAQFGPRRQHALFERPVMHWRILELLSGVRGQSGFEEIASYLAAETDGRSAFQLAGKLADLFDQYLVYRPDMLAEWEQDQGEHWQAVLWRRLAANNEDHRGRLLLRFRALGREGRLARGDLPDRVCFFGISSLAPAYLEIIAAISRLIDVHLFHLNPCRSFWEDVVSQRDLAKKRATWRRKGVSDVSEYHEVGNPLLASLGAAGREFAAQIEDIEMLRGDLYEENAADTLLAHVQNDILDLVDRTEEPAEEKTEIAGKDHSLSFHVCHGPTREVQVLHDRLLELFEQNHDLRPGDILVMAPDIETYAAAVNGVFGSAPPERRIPWSISDRPHSGEQPLVRAFLELLDLLVSRFKAGELLSFLETPAVRLRFGIDEAGLTRVRDWVRQSGIRWGVDGAHRREYGIDDSAQNSWDFGMDRLLLGFLTGSQEQYQDIIPWPGARDSEADLLGGLADFVERLRHHRSAMQRGALPGEWCDMLLALLTDFFDPQGAPDDLEALTGLRETIIELAEQCSVAGFNRELAPRVVMSHLQRLVTEPDPGRAFLSGRVTFCNMVPMRSIPFRVIWLMGMNDADYPRIQRPASFDLMAADPKLGDRDRRNDDRYLFLEALISARDHFAVSFVGRDQRDNAEKSASVVVDELRDYLDRAFLPPDREQYKKTCDFLTTEYPLQPFSRRCFDGSVGMRGYADQWLPGETAPNQDDILFLKHPLEPPEEEWQTVDIKTLARFWSHPIRFFLQERSGLRLWEKDDALEESEPFELDFLQRYKLNQHVVGELLRGEEVEALGSRLRGAGVLPHQGFGENSLAALVDLGQEMTGALSPLVATPRGSVEANITLERFRITGRLTALYAGGRVVYRAARLKAYDLLNLWLHHLALNLLAPAGVELNSIHVATDIMVRLSPVRDADGYLFELLDLYARGLREPLRFYPQTAYAYCTAKPGREMNEARKAWLGGWFMNGEGEDQAYALALRGVEPLDEKFASLAGRIFAPILEHLEEYDADA